MRKKKKRKEGTNWLKNCSSQFFKQKGKKSTFFNNFIFLFLDSSTNIQTQEIFVSPHPPLVFFFGHIFLQNYFSLKLMAKFIVDFLLSKAKLSHSRRHHPGSSVRKDHQSRRKHGEGPSHIVLLHYHLLSMRCWPVVCIKIFKSCQSLERRFMSSRDIICKQEHDEQTLDAPWEIIWTFTPMVRRTLNA